MACSGLSCAGVWFLSFENGWNGQGFEFGSGTSLLGALVVGFESLASYKLWILFFMVGGRSWWVLS
jgi:hypothetical protein